MSKLSNSSSPLDILEKLSSHSFMFITASEERKSSECFFAFFCFTWQRIDEFFIIPNSLIPLFFLSFKQQKVHNKFDSGGRWRSREWKNVLCSVSEGERKNCIFGHKSILWKAKISLEKWTHFYSLPQVMGWLGENHVSYEFYEYFLLL